MVGGGLVSAYDNKAINFAAAVSNMSFVPGRESKKGELALVMGPRRQKLQVRVYSRTLDPFVVFYPDKVHCQHCGVLKLKGCRVEIVYGSDTDFRVTPRSGDIVRAVVLGAACKADRDEWMEALSAHSMADRRVRTRSISLVTQRMPSLPELDEICSDSDHDDDSEVVYRQHGFSLPNPITESANIGIAFPRSRHDFIRNMDRLGRRTRCCTVHSSTPASDPCGCGQSSWDHNSPSTSTWDHSSPSTLAWEHHFSSMSDKPITTEEGKDTSSH